MLVLLLTGGREYENKVFSNNMIIMPNFVKIGQPVGPFITVLSGTKSGDRKPDRYMASRARISYSRVCISLL
jgi:hypothetical protein